MTHENPGYFTQALDFSREQNQKRKSELKRLRRHIIEIHLHVFELVSKFSQLIKRDCYRIDV